MAEPTPPPPTPPAGSGPVPPAAPGTPAANSAAAATLPVAGAGAPAGGEVASATVKPPAAPPKQKIITVITDFVEGDEGETETLDDPAEISELKKTDIFADIAESTLLMLPGTVARRKFRTGEVICREGEGGTTAFYIAEGEVDISIKSSVASAKQTKGGFLAAIGGFLGQRRLSGWQARVASALVPIDASVDLSYGKLAATLKPGEMFGEMSCLSRAPRSATVTARTNCVLLEILRPMYEKLLASKTFKAKTDEKYRDRALANHLRNVAIFDGLPEAAIERLRTTCEFVTVEPGQVIIKEKDLADAMFIIRLGQVRVSKALPGGELTLAYMTKGDCFGELGLLHNTTRSTTCTAYDHPKSVTGTARVGYKAKPSRVELVKIKQTEFAWLVNEYPAVKARLETLAKSRTDATESAVRTGGFYSQVPRNVEDLGLLQGQGLLLIDLEKCTRCDQCVQACVESHDDGVTRLVREGPRHDKYLVPSRCRMCIDPVCMIGCPVGSIRRTKDLNMLIEDWCIGCGICAKQCPYNSIQMHDRSDFAGLEIRDAKAKERGAEDREEKAVVCDQCSSLPQGPACVYACPHDAAFRVDARQFFQLSVSAR